MAIRSDEQLLGDIEEVRKRFILIGFKGSLAEFLADIVDSKQNRSEKVIFSGKDFSGDGTKESPIRVKFPESQDLGGLISRVEKLEQFISVLDNFPNSSD